MSRITITLPSLLLGLPMEGVENPYLAAPIGKVRVSTEIGECSSPSISLHGADAALEDLLGRFWAKLVDGLNMKLCAKAYLEHSVESPPLHSLYAAATAALVYSVGRSHGEVLDEFEIVELSRLSDPWELPWWQHALDAARMSAATGSVVVYRNDEESAELGRGELRLRLVRRSEVAPAREPLSQSSMDALVHMIGQTVVDASEAIREGAGVAEEVLRRARVQNAASHIIYGVPTPEEGCVWVPGTPLSLELVCLGR